MDKAGEHMSMSEPGVTLHRPFPRESVSAPIRQRPNPRISGTPNLPARTRTASKALAHVNDAGELADATGDLDIPMKGVSKGAGGAVRRDSITLPIRCAQAPKRHDGKRAGSITQPQLASPTRRASSALRSSAPYESSSLPRPPWLGVIAVLVAVIGAMWWLMLQRLPDIDPRQVVATNLAAARLAVQDNRLIEPPEHSAVHYFSTALAVDPTNEAAISGVDRIADRFADEAKRYIISRQLADAASAIDYLRRVRPEHRRLRYLDAQLSEALAERVHVSNITKPARTPQPQTAGAALTDSPSKRDIEKEIAGTRGAPQTVPDDQRSTMKRGEAGRPKAVPTKVNRDRTVKVADETIVSGDLALAHVRTAEAEDLDISEQVSARLVSSLEVARSNASDAAMPPTSAPVAVKPKLLRVVKPDYPRSARVRNIEGWVDLSLSVTPAGEVGDARVLRWEGSRSFERAALAAVREWRYEPRRSVDPSETQDVEVRVAFQLEE